MPAADGQVQLNLWVSKDLRRRFRRYCEHHEVSMGAIIRDMMEYQMSLSPDRVDVTLLPDLFEATPPNEASKVDVRDARAEEMIAKIAEAMNTPGTVKGISAVALWRGFVHPQASYSDMADYPEPFDRLNEMGTGK